MKFRVLDADVHSKLKKDEVVLDMQYDWKTSRLKLEL